MNLRSSSDSVDLSQEASAWTALRMDMDKVEPPAWLWWRIRCQLWLSRFHTLTTQPSRPQRLAALSAACAAAFVWLSVSDVLMQTRLPVERAISAARPLAFAGRFAESSIDHRPISASAGALGAESLALLGIPFIETMQTHPDLSAARPAQWLTDTRGQVLALRLPD